MKLCVIKTVVARKITTFWTHLSFELRIWSTMTPRTRRNLMQVHTFVKTSSSDWNVGYHICPCITLQDNNKDFFRGYDKKLLQSSQWNREINWIAEIETAELTRMWWLRFDLMPCAEYNLILELSVECSSWHSQSVTLTEATQSEFCLYLAQGGKFV